MWCFWWLIYCGFSEMYLGDTKATKSFILWKQIWCFITQVTDRKFKPSQSFKGSALWVFLGSTCQGWVTRSEPYVLKSAWSFDPALPASETHHPGSFLTLLISLLSLLHQFFSLSPRNGSTQEMGTCSRFYGISLPSLKFLSWWCQLITLL